MYRWSATGSFIVAEISMCLTFFDKSPWSRTSAIRWAPTGSIGAIPLRDDALGAKPVSMSENSRAIFGDVLDE